MTRSLNRAATLIPMLWLKPGFNSARLIQDILGDAR